MAEQPSLEEFRTEALAFLDANAERKPEDTKFVWGEGDDDVAMFEEVDPEEERRQLADAKAWRAKRYDAGLGYLTGPAEYGGRELPGSYERLYGTLESKYVVPKQS